MNNIRLKLFECPFNPKDSHVQQQLGFICLVDLCSYDIRAITEES